MKEDKIWEMVYCVKDEDVFEVKDGIISIVNPSHICMIEIRNVKLKDGKWRIEGKGANKKPVKYNGDSPPYGGSPNMPKIDLPCKVSLGSMENIYKVLKQMRSAIGNLVIMKSNGKTLEITAKSAGWGSANEINAIIPTTNIDDDARSFYDLPYLMQLFRYLNPTSLEFGENFPIKLEGKNWTFFLAPRIEDNF